MDKRKDTISTLKICRFCLTQEVPMASLYDKKRKIKNTVNLPLKILSLMSVEVFPSDKMPTYICGRCRYFMNLCYDFKNICRQADEAILHYIQDNKPFKPIPWPMSLNDAYRESNDIGVMKTVIEGGTTVQVTHDITDSEDEEENVYNVKISDGNDEVSKTCVKVVASRDNEEKVENKGFSSVTKLSRHVRTHAGERPYPCKYCDKSFMKSHHYTRHVRMKHREEERARAGNSDTYPCEQCDETFGGQDELIYHSAIHATQNLTCPLCQEKFDNVDDVTAHIKSHVNGMEFMCDFCELVFTTKEKLENHLMLTHEEEIQNELGQDDSSMDAEDMKADGEGDADEDDDNSINVKEEDDHNMVIEIKKPDEFLLKNRKPAEPTEAEEKLGDNSNSEDSDAEINYMEQATLEKLPPAKIVKETLKPVGVFPKPVQQAKPISVEKFMVRKSEEVKRAPIQQRLNACDSPVEKKEKHAMAQITKIETGNDKSLRLLEKELQDLKRTNSRSEAVKTPPVKMMETPRGRGRPPLHTSTPKIKPTEEKKTLVITKTPAPEKKQIEKKMITKENKEPKVVKETKPINNKEDKDINKSVVKNGTNEKSSAEDGIRRSTRPCKIKDYAKMIRVNSQENSDSDELDDDDDEYRQGDKTLDGRVRARRNSVRPAKSSPAPTALAATPTTPATPATPTTPTTAAAMPPRKRGRPRKEQPKEIPSKIKKTDQESESEPITDIMEEKPPPETNKPSAAANQSSATANLSNAVTEQSVADAKQDEDSQDSVATEPEPEADTKIEEEEIKREEVNNAITETRKSPNAEPEAPQSPSKLLSPTGQTLKKIPIRSLPPGVKPLPLPLVSRNIPSGELCQMQIGKKVVKVQKIVMTKAEVEAMAKQGLVEMKDGTMVLKQGVKLPKVEPLAAKPIVGEDKDSPSKRERAVPTRCNFGDE